MSSTAQPTVELRGTFCGFFRDIFGKRRMALHVGKEELYLKVPKLLRDQLLGKLAAGDELIAVGVEEGGRFTVSSVRSASGVAICAACPIRVCVKKNCWRSGGRELWATLERRLAEVGLSGVVALKEVNCLDHCKHAPNAEWQGRAYRKCGPTDAAAIVARVAAELGAGVAKSTPTSHAGKAVVA